MKNLQTIYLYTFPILVGIYAIYLRISNQPFQDIAAILMSIVSVSSVIITYLLSRLVKPELDKRIWYLNILLGLFGVIITFGALVVYARLNG